MYVLPLYWQEVILGHSDIDLPRNTLALSIGGQADVHGKVACD